MACTNIGNYNITCLVQNQIFSSIMTWMVDSSPLDLSIYDQIYFDVFLYNKRIIRKTLGDGIAVSGADNNVLTITLDQEDTVKINQQGMNHELRFVNGSGENNYLIKGSISVQLTESRNDGS